MQFALRWSLLAFAAALVLSCSSDSSYEAPAPTLTAPPVTATATATTAPSPTPQPIRQDIQATRLQVPSLNIDAEVQSSLTIPYVDIPLPGCPARPQDTQTVTVPEQGIATPVDSLEGLENKAWIYGHSRWQNRPGIFLRLQDIRVGDELFIDGVDRKTGEQLRRQKFVVDAIYLTDTDSGDELINAKGPADIPAKPIVLLQTSVRESGAGKQWILNQQEVLAKATNLVQGDLNDPCKYLLLFVHARPA